MNVKMAADGTALLLSVREPKISGVMPNAEAAHLAYMNQAIQNGEVTGEKAHRWLGYMQGVMVARGFATLEEMKLINKTAD